MNYNCPAEFWIFTLILKNCKQFCYELNIGNIDSKFKSFSISDENIVSLLITIISFLPPFFGLCYIASYSACNKQCKAYSYCNFNSDVSLFS